MAVIIGSIIVIGSVLAGFSMAGGHVHALIHPSEFVTIGGATFGACGILPKRVLVDLAKGCIQLLKGVRSPRPPTATSAATAVCIFRLAQRDGLLALDNLSSPEKAE
ncbi:MAG: motility-associated protein [Planctomycetaceae bacterium]